MKLSASTIITAGLAMLLAGCGGGAAPASSPAASSPAAKPSTAASAAASASAKPSTPAPAASAALSTKPAVSGSAAASGGAPLLIPSVAAAGNASPLSPTVKIPFGDNQNLSLAAIFIGLDRGYFKAEGLELDLVQMPVTQIIQSLATNQVSFSVANPDPALFNALDRGVEIKLLASLVNNKPGDAPAAFLVRQDLIDDGKYKSPKDLKGMNVGIPASQSQFYVNLVMSKDGLTADDVKLVTLNSIADIPVAFTNKSIDGVWSTEPTNSVLIQRHLATKVAVTGDLFPGAVGVTLGVAPEFAKNQPEASQRFVNAFLRGLRDYYHAFVKKDADKRPVIDIFIRHTPLKDPALYDQMALSGVDPNGSVDLSSWDVLQDYFVKAKLQQKKIDLNKYIDHSFIDKAVALLGKE